MTIYILDTTVNSNAPRILWRNTIMDEQGVEDYDTFRDPMTWKLEAVPAVIEMTLVDGPIACNAIGISRGQWSGQTVVVEYDDGAGWVQLGAWQPTRGQPFVGVFEFQTAASWRITILGATLIASVIRFGMALAMQRNTYVGVRPINKQVNKSPSNQLGSHFLGSKRLQERREQEFSFSKITPDWLRAFYKPWVEASKRESAFVAWRPTAYPKDVIYGFCDDDIKASNEMANGMMTTKFNIEGTLE